MRKVMLLLPLFLAFACQDDYQKEVEVNDFAGFYIIRSITADVEVDMNNDGRGSTDILTDMCSPQVSSDGEVWAAFPKENLNPIYLAEVCPNTINGTVNEYQFISFNFPRQSIGWMVDEPESDPFLRSYLESMMNYTYEFTDTKEVEVYPGSPAYSIGEGIIHSLIRTDKDTFILTFSTRLFNFLTTTWEPVSLVVVYERTEWGA